MSNKPISSVYLHISNGGVQFAFYDDEKHGPTIQILSTHMGNNSMMHCIYTDKHSMGVLADAMRIAAEHDYQYPPCVEGAIAWQMDPVGGQELIE